MWGEIKRLAEYFLRPRQRCQPSGDLQSDAGSNVSDDHSFSSAIQHKNFTQFRFQPGFRVAERPDGPAGEDATLEALPRRLHLGAQGRPHRLRLPRLPPLRRTVHIRVAVRVRTDLCPVSNHAEIFITFHHELFLSASILKLWEPAWAVCNNIEYSIKPSSRGKLANFYQLSTDCMKSAVHTERGCVSVAMFWCDFCSFLRGPVWASR